MIVRITAVVLALVIVACNPVRSGKIIEKIYHPAWTETGFNSVTVSYDPPITTLVPYSTYHPERFCLRLEGEVKGKTKEGIVEVPSETYHKVSVGELYGVEAQ